MYPQVFGKYVLERELARGGMARVVLATLRGAGGFEKRLVVKQIRDELACDDEFVRRFVDEAKTTVALAHPNIVPVYELGVERGTYFLAMEWVQGASVAELLRASAPRGLSPEEGAYIGVEVCRALDYAHRRMNLVHRDVTPRNVMVDEEGQVKVIDFGIAAPAATTPNGQGVFGSPGHMPPEQMNGTQLTPTADVFAVAVLLMEVWSGRPLFRRRTNEEIAIAMRAPVPRPSELDPKLAPLDDVVTRALSLDSADRPQQADDLARALRRFLAGVELGDLARQLGELVRRARSQSHASSTQDGPTLQRPPSRPTATQIGTRTFAASDAIRPPIDDPAGQPSTRRTVSSPPPARSENASTQPIETAPKTGGRTRIQRRLAWGTLVGVGAAGFVALLATQGAAFKARDIHLAMTPGAAPVGSTSSTHSAADVESASRRIPAVSTVQEPTAPARSSPVPSRADLASSSERAQLVLLGNGTTVFVDGVSRGPCPLRLAVEPGAHLVRFAFATTGETKSQTVVLRAGDRSTLRADFTGAVPAIRVIP